MTKPLKYLVCAGTVPEAHAWADQYGIPHSHVIHATPRSAHIQGIVHFAVVRLPGHFQTPEKHQARIERIIRVHERKRPRGKV